MFMKFFRVFGTMCVLSAIVVAAAGSAQAAGNVSYGVTVGKSLPSDADTVRVGRETFYVYNGSFYRQVKNGYVLVPAPIGARIRELPRGANTKFKIGRTTYYRHGDVCYKATHRRYEVCAAPEGAPAAADDAANANVHLTVRLGDDTYLFVDGRFYLQILRSPDGLLGRSIPIGAVARDFPNDAISVWYRDREYFEQNGVFFREDAGGFQVVPPPWKRTPVVTDEAIAQASAN